MTLFIVIITIIALILPFLLGWIIISFRSKHAPTTLHTSPLPLEIGSVRFENIQDTSYSCHLCRNPVRPKDRFCSQCGHRCGEKTFLPLATNQRVNNALERGICTSCHASLLAQDQFCGMCGRSIQADTQTTYLFQ